MKALRGWDEGGRGMQNMECVGFMGVGLVVVVTENRKQDASNEFDGGSVNVRQKCMGERRAFVVAAKELIG